ncbi:hypothetical protein WH47_05215 [Habropoda laboriosa]|uniref:Uncharacterized protein n=1 Tax=Habropoda laboriosa TaxID=597456 RepID=A0A0L7QTZ7_9HYME|nr:hypothetical protein WH47_05215 [Habropoda laboriosa]
MIRQTINDDEALTVLYIKIAHTRELFGTGSIEDLEYTRRVVYLDLFSIKVLDCRIVLLHETSRNKLHGKCTLAYPARAEDDYLELAHLFGSSPPSPPPPPPRRVQDREEGSLSRVPSRLSLHVCSFSNTRESTAATTNSVLVFL